MKSNEQADCSGKKKRFQQVLMNIEESGCWYCSDFKKKLIEELIFRCLCGAMKCL